MNLLVQKFILLIIFSNIKAVPQQEEILLPIINVPCIEKLFLPNLDNCIEKLSYPLENPCIEPPAIDYFFEIIEVNENEIKLIVRKIGLIVNIIKITTQTGKPNIVKAKITAPNKLTIIYYDNDGESNLKSIDVNIDPVKIIKVSYFETPIKNLLKFYYYGGKFTEYELAPEVEFVIDQPIQAYKEDNVIKVKQTVNSPTIITTNIADTSCWDYIEAVNMKFSIFKNLVWVEYQDEKFERLLNSNHKLVLLIKNKEGVLINNESVKGITNWTVSRYFPNNALVKNNDNESLSKYTKYLIKSDFTSVYTNYVIWTESDYLTIKSGITCNLNNDGSISASLTLYIKYFYCVQEAINHGLKLSNSNKNIAFLAFYSNGNQIVNNNFSSAFFTLNGELTKVETDKAFTLEQLLNQTNKQIILTLANKCMINTKDSYGC